MKLLRGAWELAGIVFWFVMALTVGSLFMTVVMPLGRAIAAESTGDPAPGEG